MLVGVFSGSMSPSNKAKAARSQHDISKLTKGSYLFERFQRANSWSGKVLIIKDWDENIYVHMIPTETDSVIMPERFWGWGYYQCKNFGPDLNKNRSLVKLGKIRCHDKDAPEWMAKEQWVWKYSGKSEGIWMDDMYSPSYDIQENTLYING